jgi:hypothetical protein
MLLNLFIFIATFALVIMTVVIWLQVAALRRGRTIMSNHPTLVSIVLPQAERLYGFVFSWVAWTLHHTYLALLLAGKQILAVSRRVITKVEKRFTKVISTVRGKGALHKRGSASLFLREIGDHQDQFRATLGDK